MVRNKNHFFERVVVITGAGAGIGAYLALAIAAAGGRVVGLDTHCPTSNVTGIHFYPCDVSSWDSVQKVFRQATNEIGPPDILINNAAVSTFQKPIEEISPDEFKRVIDVNLVGTFYCCKAFVEMTGGETCEKRIINIASTRYLMNEPHWEAYGASKGGVVSLTQSLAISLASRNTTVNCIAPGWIATLDDETLTTEDHEQHPSGRVGNREDIFRAIEYLSQKGNNFINGQTLVIDGGMTKKMIYK